MLAGRVREHAAAVGLGERLRGRAATGAPRPSRARISPGLAGVQRERGGHDDRVAGERRRPVREPHLARGHRLVPCRRRARRRPTAPTTSPICPSWAPAFMRTAPPRSPGSPRRTRARRARAAARPPRGRAAASRRPPSPRPRPAPTNGNPRPRRSTRPGNPSSDTRTFDPLPMTATGIVRLADRPARRRADRPRPRARGTATAGPPTRNVVSGAIETCVAHAVATRRAQDRACLGEPALGHSPSSSSIALRADRVAEHPDVAAPHRHDEVALAHLVGRGRSRRRDGAAGTRPRVGRRPSDRGRDPVDDELAGHARDRGPAPPRRRPSPRRGRRRRRWRRARATAPAPASTGAAGRARSPGAGALGARRVDRHRHLRRVVPVVVEELGAAGPTSELEPSMDTVERGERPPLRPPDRPPTSAATAIAAVASKRLCAAVHPERQRDRRLPSTVTVPRAPVRAEVIDTDGDSRVGRQADTSRPRRPRARARARPPGSSPHATTSSHRAANSRERALDLVAPPG